MIINYYTLYCRAQTRTDSNPTPVFGPSIQFAGQAARWTGDSYSFADQVGIEARVNFETVAGDRVTSYLTIINNGTTSIYYDWKVRENILVHSTTEQQITLYLIFSYISTESHAVIIR